ncbi:nitroreductase [Fusobacteria bacterium ZRK30]|nr:nitroreductase [Fusobacteria bacterium ZRK30]
MNKVIENIKSRRTTRKFTDTPVEREKLEIIIEAGMWAPSGNNKQSWHFTVVQDEQLLKRLNMASKENASKSEDEYIRNAAKNMPDVFYGAKTVIVVSASEDAHTPIEDISAATQNMLLAAESMGVGTCWNGMRFLFNFMPEHDVIKDLQLPEGVKPFHAVVVGYKGIEGKAPKRKEGVVQFL